MTNELSPADIAAVTGNNNGGMFGGNGDWGAWIILFLLFGMFGNGYGGFGGGGVNGVNDVWAANNYQTILGKLDNQTYGIADATFALNNTMTTGFSNAELSRCNMQASFMQQLNNMAMADQKCCCETQRLIERGFCDIGNDLHGVARDIIDSQNNGTRAILDALTQQRIEAKDAEIARQNQMLFEARLRESQATQNAYLVGTLRPAPVPAYQVANPYASFGYGACGCNC